VIWLLTCLSLYALLVTSITAWKASDTPKVVDYAKIEALERELFPEPVTPWQELQSQVRYITPEMIGIEYFPL
jgi:hypothetical protein